MAVLSCTKDISLSFFVFFRALPSDFVYINLSI